jgi:signal peptidase II
VDEVRRHRGIACLVAILALGLDQVSKQWALATLRSAGVTMALPGPVDLTLVFNRSNAFGLVPLSGELTRWGLAGLNLAVAAVLVWVAVRRTKSQLSLLGLAFIVAGAVGNAVDRIRFGAVVDFINASKLRVRMGVQRRRCINRRRHRLPAPQQPLARLRRPRCARRAQPPGAVPTLSP